MLRLAVLLVLIAPAALAQPDTSKFVGAVPKADIAALGASPTVTTVATSGAAQTIAFPAYGAAAYDVTLSANCTFTISATNAVAGQRTSIFLTLRNPAGTFTTTLPGTIKWSNGSALTIATTAGTVTLIEFVTTDGGTTVVAQ